MATYTRHEFENLDVYVSDDTNKVHHAVNYKSFNPVTLYPYEPGKYGGLDNCCNCYTLRQVKNRMKKGTICFK